MRGAGPGNHIEAGAERVCTGWEELQVGCVALSGKVVDQEVAHGGFIAGYGGGFDECSVEGEEVGPVPIRGRLNRILDFWTQTSQAVLCVCNLKRGCWR